MGPDNRDTFGAHDPSWPSAVDYSDDPADTSALPGTGPGTVFDPNRWRRTVLRVCLIAAFLLTLATPARTTAQSIEQLKAVFLFNFPKFVEWPDGTFEADPVIRFGIVGDCPFLSQLKVLSARKQIKGLRVDVRTFDTIEAANEASDIVYIAADKRRPSRGSPLDLDKGAGKRAILWVGEEEAFLNDGGIIAFTVKERRLRYLVNLAAPGAAQLKMRPQFLETAEKVILPPDRQPK